jgi:recombination protein RecA
MMHAGGISYEGDVLDLAMAQKFVVRSGAWFRYGELQMAQGREKARQYLQEHPELTEELRQKILAAGTVNLTSGVGGGSDSDEGGTPAGDAE